MANVYDDPMYVFPTDGSDGGRARPGVTSPMTTPGQTSMTGVFAGPPTPSLSFAVSGLPGAAEQAGAAACRSPCGDNVMSVVARDGEEMHYPVVHGRAGGSLVQHLNAGPDSTSTNAASRALRHASLLAAGAADPEEGRETPAERTENYQQSRATPSSIRRHRHGSRGHSRSPPPAVALRGEPVEDTVRATNSAAASLSSSLTTTPRQSLRRTPASTPLHDLQDGDRRHHRALVDGVSVRVEEMGVSTPEMAEYFADAAVEGQFRSSAALPSSAFGGSSSSLPSRRAFVTPRHSQHFGTAVPTAHYPHGDTPAAAAAASGSGQTSLLERLMQMMEEQAAVSQQVLRRLDTLESTNNALAERFSRLETAMETNVAQRGEEAAITRVSAESASPSVTRTSGSVDSAARPSTRAPSKAVS